MQVTRTAEDVWCCDGAEAAVILRPDGKGLVRLPTGRPDLWATLAAAVAHDAPGPLVLELDETDTVAADALGAVGFRATRREQHWRIPLDRLPDRRVTADRHHVIRVTDADPERVARLDNEIRQDIPGAVGWDATAEDLLSTLSDDEFDPELYLIAVHSETDDYDGLVRVWNRSPAPRLGCLGVRRPWRRTRLAAALLYAVALPLRQRGVRELITETDVLNRDSHGMVAHVGGVPTGVRVEWERPTR